MENQFLPKILLIKILFIKIYFSFFFTHIFRKSIRYIVDQRCETTFKESERSASIPFLLRPRRAIEVALQPAMVIESPSGLANHRTSIAIRRYPKRFVCAIVSASAATCCFCSMRRRKPAIIIMANTPALSRFPPFLFISSLRAASSLLLFARLFHVHSIFLDFPSQLLFALLFLWSFSFRGTLRGQRTSKCFEKFAVKETRFCEDAGTNKRENNIVTRAAKN